jgi:hypothetical protein
LPQPTALNPTFGGSFICRIRYQACSHHPDWLIVLFLENFNCGGIGILSISWVLTLIILILIITFLILIIFNHEIYWLELNHHWLIG